MCRLVLRAARWTVTGEAPSSGVLVGAPHTSNWDFILLLLVMGSVGVSPLVMIKRELFRGPLGWFLRKTGGVPVDRRHPVGLVRELTRRFAAGESFLLVIAPEGMRRASHGWKSGFYRIATLGKMPITLAYIDGPTRTAGFGPAVVPSGDITADMDVIRAFYADKHGLRPAWRTEPRLSEERGHGPTPNR